MKRLFGRKKKKVKNDDDILYRPPSVDSPAAGNASVASADHQHHQQQHSPAHAHAAVASTTYPTVQTSRSSSYGHQSLASSSIPPPPTLHASSSTQGSAVRRSATGESAASDAGASTQTDATSGYRHALAAYAETINPAHSNEDGMGGGGGTLRSRSGRVRGSAGLKHRGSLIPVFEDLQPPPPSGVGSVINDGSVGGGANSSIAGGAVSSAGGVVAAALSPASSAVTSSSVRQERVDTYERLMQGGLKRVVEDHEKEEGTWAPIPEEPRNNNNEDVESGENLGRAPNNNSVTFQTNNDSESNQQQSQEAFYQQSHQMNNIQAPSRSIDPSSQNYDNVSGLESSTHSTTKQRRQKAIHLDPTRSLSPQSISSHSYHNTSPSSIKEGHHLILQPDAIYEEHYGDAYVDGLIKYLYPAGYQSMRPRSGPWKLSIFIFLLFLWLSVFIVGHCYDRGQREYNYYFDNADDAYLQEVDDDQLVMETRWCGSKPLYFMWLVSVWITVLSMSYCSIIGYVKVRDIAVANGRSQPSGMDGRSDFYVMVENVSSTNVRGMADDAAGNNSATAKDSEVSSGYSSYQDGNHGSRRYRPSIYQSDGAPQFWGGHIYRPTQAAVTMTNRP